MEEMSVIILLGIIFLEVLAALTGVAACIFVFKEFMQRKRFFLLLFSLAFLVFGGMYALVFFSQVLSLFGGTGIVTVLIRISHVMIGVSGMLIMFGLADMFLRGSVQKTAFGAIAGVFATILVIDAYRDFSIVFVQGLPFGDFTLRGMFPFFGGAVAAHVSLIVAPAVKATILKVRGAHLEWPDKYLFWSGVFGLLGGVLTTVTIALRVPMAILGVFAMLLLSLFLMLIGVMAWEHPDRRLVERPYLVFFRSFLMKTSGLNTILYGLLVFFLVAFTASHFLSAANTRHFDIVEGVLVMHVSNFEQEARELTEDAERLAFTPSVIRVFETQGTSESRAAVAPLLGSFNPESAVRLLGMDGSTILSEGPVEDFRDSSRVFLSAATGVAMTALEEESFLSGSLALRGGAPVYGGSGDIIGVVMVTGMRNSFAEFAEFSALGSIVGHGFITEDDQIVYEAGEGIDARTRDDIERILVGVTTIHDVRIGDDVYSLARVFGVDREPIGYFYMYSSDEVLAAETARILVVVAMLSLLATLLVLFILLYATDRVVRPIRQLADASRKIESGDFDVHIDHESTDELGVLADAFNHMTETIGDQTIHLKEALREQKDFLLHTAHEMRNPLNHFRWTLEMLRFGEVGTLNQEQLEMIDQLNRTSERLQRMVQNIMVANRLTEGKMRPKYELAALEDIIDDVAGSIVVDVRRKNINLHWKYPLSPLPKVNIDTKMMHRVLANLFSNAVKYTEKDGHIEISVKEVNERKPGGKKGAYLQVSVEDNGIGIAEEEQARMFTLFFRTEDVVEKDVEGTGLGLFITKKLVGLHKGALWFESQKGKGSTFYFTVPLAGSDPKKR